LVAPDANRYDSHPLSYEERLRATNVDDKAHDAVDHKAMDRADLEQQLQAHHTASFGWALACCDRERDDAEDVLQTVYVKVLEGKARFEGRAAFRTWLFAVIRRTAAAHRRTRWLRRFRILPYAADPADEREPADRLLVRSERTAALLRGLERLSRRQREVLELVFYHDLTIEQAGQTLGISLGSARVHYDRGKKRLFASLEERP
jgi:RNA polymerase sigma-70 factor (ECF subfamily)